MTSPFNPALFAKKEESEQATTAATHKKTPYESTGNASRDGVRKMLYEIFQAEDEPTACRLAKEIEEALFSAASDDARSRVYRDKGRQVQMKLKGPRFTDQRQKLRSGELTAQEVCSDEWLSAKAAAPQTAPMGGASRGRGMPMGPGRGRGGPTIPGMRGAPRGIAMPGRPPAPAFKPPVQQLPQTDTQNSEIKEQPKDEKLIQEAKPPKEQEPPKIEEPVKQQEQQPVVQEAFNPVPTPQVPQENKVVEEVPKVGPEVQKQQENPVFNKPDPSELPMPAADLSQTIETSKIELQFDDSTLQPSINQKEELGESNNAGMQFEEPKPEVAQNMPLAIPTESDSAQKQSLDDSMMSGRGSHGGKKKKVVKKVVKKKKVVPKQPDQVVPSPVTMPAIVQSPQTESPEEVKEVLKEPVREENLVKEMPRQKPKELTPEEVKAVQAQRKKFAPLTAENLQKQFQEKRPDLDIDTESILLLESQIISPSNAVKQQPKLPSAPKSSSLQNDVEVHRLNEQIQSKKQTICQLQDNLQMTQTDLELLKKKYELVQDENKRIKAQNQTEKIDLLKLQQTMTNERKTAQEIQKQQNAEISTLKEQLMQANLQNQKLQDRYQKVVQGSRDQRDRLERQLQILIEQQTGNAAHEVHDQGRRLVGENDKFDDQVGVNPNNQQDLQVQLAEIRRQYEQQINNQKRQLDQALGRLQQEQRMNHKFRQNNRNLAQTVMNLENGGRNAMDEDAEEEVEEMPRETGSNLIDTIHIQQIAAGSGSNTNEIFMPNYVDMNQEEEIKELEIPEGQSTFVEVKQGIEPSALNNSLLDRGQNQHRLNMYFESEEATGGETNLGQQQFGSHQQSQQETVLNLNGDAFNESGQQESGQTQNLRKLNQTEKGQQREQQESGKQFEEQKSDGYSEGEENSHEDDEEYKSDGSSVASDNEDDEEDDQESQESNQPGDLGSEADQQINSRNQNARADIGGLSESNPAAIMPSQNQLQGQNSLSRGFNSQRPNNPFAYSNSQQTQQYGTGSSGASGNINQRSNLQTQGGSQNLQAANEDGQAAGNYISQAPAAGQGGFSQGTTGSGGPPTSHSQRRNRRGYRQQNQQPSSGANERPDSRMIASQPTHLNTSRPTNPSNATMRQGQGRQAIARSLMNQQLNSKPEDVDNMISTGLGTSAAASAFGQTNQQIFEPQSMPGQSQSPTAGNESRSRAQRVHNRGRQARNNQQTTAQSQQSLTQQSLPVSQSTNQQIGPEPASLSQEREQNAAEIQRQSMNQRLARGAGSGASEQNQQQDLSQAVQQVRQVNVPASSQSQGQFNRPPTDSQSSTIQGAAQQTSSYSNMPASTASHSGGPVTGATQRGHGYPGQNQASNQGQSNVPHGGGGVTRPQQPSQSSHQAAVMHHFDSGSTGFASNVPQSHQNPESYQNNNQNQRNQRVASSGSAGGVPYTQISSVSSPPSNNLGVQGNMFNQIPNMAASEPNSQSRNQQNEHSGNQNQAMRQNAQELNGPGAVGAPPSSQTQVPAAQNIQSNRYQPVPNMSEESMPISSGGNTNQNQTNWPSVQRQPSDQRAVNETQLSAPMSLNQGLGGSQQPTNLNTQNRSNQMAVPQNNEDLRRNMSSSLFEEEKKQSSNQNQQQSVVNIPSSVFGVSRQDEQRMNASKLFEQNQPNQQPAAFQAQQRNSQGANIIRQQQNIQRPSINFNHDIAAAASSGSLTTQGDRGNTVRNLRNNDSRKTSGANTPSKDGASTPTTQQQLQSIQGRTIGQNNQAQMPSGHSPAEFSSAVSASLNSHLQNNMGQGQMGGAQSNANNNQQQHYRPFAGASSSLFEENNESSNARGTANLFDDFADYVPSDSQQVSQQQIANPFANSQTESHAQGHQEAQLNQQNTLNSGEQASAEQDNKGLIPKNMFD